MDRIILLFLIFISLLTISCSKKSGESYGKGSTDEEGIKKRSEEELSKIQKELKNLKNKKPKPSAIERVSRPFTIDGFKGLFVKGADSQNRFVVSGKISLKDILIRRFQITVKVACLEDNRLISAVFVPKGELKNGSLLEIPFFAKTGLKAGVSKCEVKFGYENSLGGNKAVDPLYFCIDGGTTTTTGRCTKPLFDRTKFIKARKGEEFSVTDFKLDKLSQKGVLHFSTHLYSKLDERISHKVTVMGDGKKIKEVVFTYFLRDLDPGESRMLTTNISLTGHIPKVFEFLFSTVSILSSDVQPKGAFCFSGGLVVKGRCKSTK